MMSLLLTPPNISSMSDESTRDRSDEGSLIAPSAKAREGDDGIGTQKENDTHNSLGNGVFTQTMCV